MFAVRWMGHVGLDGNAAGHGGGRRAAEAGGGARRRAAGRGGVRRGALDGNTAGHGGVRRVRRGALDGNTAGRGEGRRVRSAGEWARPGVVRGDHLSRAGWPGRSPVCHHKPVTDMYTPGAAFRAARDLLLRYREDYEAARREFGWPRFDQFNWALDWFDVIAAEHPDRDALRIVAEGGSDVRLSYAEMAARSSQAANWLRDLGVRRGDRMLLMLGNIAPLWEVILAAIKLGAVVIPATTLLGPDDIADRISRGDVRHVITESAQAPKFGAAAATGGWTPIAVGEPDRRLAALRGCVRRRRWTPRMAYAGRAIRCCCTSPRAPPRSPSWSSTRTPPTRSAPVHHVLARPAAGRRPPQRLLPRLGQARLVERVRPVERRGHGDGARARAVLGRRAARGHSGLRRQHAVRAADRVADADPVRPRRLRHRQPARVVSAGEPLNPEVIERVRRAWGITVRDGYGQTETTAQIGNTPGQPVKLGSMGRRCPATRSCWSIR